MCTARAQTHKHTSIEALKHWSIGALGAYSADDCQNALIFHMAIGRAVYVRWQICSGRYALIRITSATAHNVP